MEYGTDGKATNVEPGTDSQGVIFYKYLTVAGAIDIIENKRWLVSLPNMLNDPFEFAPGIEEVPSGVSSQDLEGITNGFLDELSEIYGVVCFSRTNSNLLLWSHYADGHKGVLLELGCLPNKDVINVVYKDTRPAIRYSQFLSKDERDREHIRNAYIKCCMTKQTSWAYEQEIRFIIDLSKCEPDSNHLYHSIAANPGFIRRIILGFKCQEGVAKMQGLARRFGFDEVEVVRARRHPTHYAIDIPDSVAFHSR